MKSWTPTLRLLTLLLLATFGASCSGLRSSEVEVGDVLSLISSTSVEHGPDYGVVKVVSIDGDGCCIIVADYMEERPKQMVEEDVMGICDFRVLADRWKRVKPRRMGRVTITEADRAYCASFRATPPVGCDVEVADDVALSAVQTCRLELLRQRCGERDGCLARCIARGGERVGKSHVIAGGCFHLCGTGGTWTPPPGWEECAQQGVSPKAR